MYQGSDVEVAPGAASRAMVVELGSAIRVGVFVLAESEYRLLTVGDAASTLDAPDFDLTLGYETALARAQSLAGAFAFPALPMGSTLASAQSVAAVVGRALESGPSCFLIGNLVGSDLEVLEAALDQHGFRPVGRAVTAARVFRDRIDGPATLDVVSAQRPDVILVALGDDHDGHGLAYMADLLVGGVPGTESGYAPVIAVVGKGGVDERAVTALKQVFLVHVATIPGGTSEVEVGIRDSSLMLDRVVKSVDDRRFRGRLVPEPIARAPTQSTASAIEIAAQGLAAQQGLNVVVVSLDDDQVMIAGCQANELASVGVGQRSDFSRAHHVALHTPVDRVAQWIADAPLPQAMRLTALNRSAHPSALAFSPAELQLWHAIWIAAARQAIRDSEDGRSPINQEGVDLAVLTGRAAQTVGRPVQAALLLANILETVGITQFALDPASSLAMHGALAGVGGGQVGLETSLVPLGVCIAPKGRARPGEPAVLVEVRPDSGSRIEREVAAGSLDVIQWDSRVPAEIRIWPHPRFDVGLGNGRPAQLKVSVEAGLIGVVVDARGRPLSWPDEQHARQARLQEWFRSVDAFPASTTGTVQKGSRNGA